MKNKKIILYITMTLILGFSLLFISACDKMPKAVNYEVDISATDLDIEAKIPLEFDPNSLELKDPTVYNRKVAMLSFIAGLDAHNTAIASVEGCDNTDEKNNTAFLTYLGFENVVQVKAGEGVTEDTNDTEDILFGTYKYPVKNKFNFVFILLRGTEGNAEWENNLDLGSDSKEYYDLTGNHSDWTNKENHKGFDVTTTRILKCIKAYLLDNNLKASNTYLCVSGYSRGAALANLVGARIDDGELSNEVYKTSTYTFATPYTTVNKDAKSEKYNNIFNIINEDDFIQQLPPSKLGFVRYGVDKTMSIGASNALLGAFKEIAGHDYGAAVGFSSLIDSMNSLCTTREEYYKVIDNEALRVKFTSLGYETALSKKVEVEQYFKDNGLYDLITINDVFKNCDDEYEFNYMIYPYFISKFLIPVVNALNGSGSVLTLFSMLEYVNCESIINLITENISLFSGTGVVDGHYPISYYVILTQTN